jgi:hypothetical protein
MIAGLVLLIAVGAIPLILQGVMNLLNRLESRGDGDRYGQRHA